MLRLVRSKKSFVILLVFILSISSQMPGYAITFKDTSGYWAENSIIKLASLNIVNGSNGHFNPTDGVSRAEFAAMVVKALGLANQAEVVKGYPTGFNDVDAAHWASGFVTVAKENGIITGYSDNTFKPSALIQRDEITSVLVRALNLTLESEFGSLTEVFKDEKEIPSWALDAVKVAYNYKLINGFPDGNFYPKHNATRGETSVLIEKVLQELGSEYTFYGQIQNVDEGSRSLTIDINGQIESFLYRPDVQVRIKGNPSTINKLEPGIGVSIILDDSGYINFVESTGGIAPGLNQTSDFESPEAVSLAYKKDEVYPTKDNTVATIVAVKKGKTDEVYDFISSTGGTVSHIDKDMNFMFANVRESLLLQLRVNPLVDEVTLDERVKVEGLSAGVDGDAGLISDSDPGKSLNVTKEAIKAPEYVKLTHADGKNQVVAIIDTGVDVGHPDLQTTSGNKQKIIEWRDFTHEGDINTSTEVQPTGNILNLANGQYLMGKIKSISGHIKYGYIREVDMVNNNGKNGYDLNFNGNESDVFGVIVVDSKIGGKYGTVYVDTNDNKDFSDEKPLNLFADSYEYASFTGDQGQDQLNFVLTEIEPNGNKINLGFDGNDHGTHVAGIVAANGKIKGVAPGAQIMSLKVLDAAGYGKLSTITEAMTYAASHGAKIINLSLGFPISDDNGGSVPATILNSLTEKYGAIFIVAAGNDGPGLSTVDTPGDASAALSVGAFNTPEMWKTDYGWNVPDEGLWFFSSVGPRWDGVVQPSIVAPGSVISTVPLRSGKRYFLSEGTSISAPHVAGAVALLMEVIQRNNLKVSPAMLKRALESGTRTIQGYTNAEQGYGALNLPRAWAELLSLRESKPISVETPGLQGDQAGGVFFREGLPRKVTLYLKNNSDRLRSMNISGGSWISPAQREVNIPPSKTRAIDFNINVPIQKGLFSSFISLDDPFSYGKDGAVLVTVINPYKLDEGSDYNTSINDEEKPAQYKRYFFKVPPGADSIKAELIIPEHKGRAKIFLFDPTGKLTAESKTFAGANPDGDIASVNVVGNSPGAGVWEAVVYCSAGLSSYGLSRTEYNLNVRLEGSNIGEQQQQSREITVGVNPKLLHAGVRNYVTVQVRDRFTKKPFEGFVEINGELYYTHGGRAVLPIDLEGSSFNIVVKTVPESSQFKPWEIDCTLYAG